jgi:hypothetical protein
MLIGKCRLPVLRRRLPVCLNRIKVENVSIISIRAASHDENVDHVTADSKKSPIAKWIVISSGLFGIFFLHQYANSLGEKTSAAASFHERYPDPRIPRFHQQVKIPDIMAKMTRGPGGYCSDQWVEFEECFTQYTSTKINRGFKENLEGMGKIGIGACSEHLKKLKKCQEDALWDDELYFKAKEEYLEKQHRLMISKFPTAQSEIMEEHIQKGIPLYTSFENEKQLNFVLGLVKEYGQEDIYLNEKGEWIDRIEKIENNKNPDETPKDAYNRHYGHLEENKNNLNSFRTTPELLENLEKNSENFDLGDATQKRKELEEKLKKIHEKIQNSQKSNIQE